MPLPLLTGRLMLRPFTANDVAAMHRVYGDPQVMRHVGDGAATDIDGTRAMVLAYMDQQAAAGYSFWAVAERATGEVIGDAGLYPVDGDAVELGYTLGRAWWGRGYATEAAAACVRYAFDEAGVPELVALALRENPASLHVLGKLGFEEAGMRLAHGREHVLLRLRADTSR